MICPIIATTARTAAELVNTMTQLRARGATATAPNLGNRMKRIYHTKRIAEASARYYTITPKEKPPLGLMGGSVHDYERGKDPFARECMPPEFQDRFPDKPAATGWLALDWCGNVIAFAQDGHRIILSSPNAKMSNAPTGAEKTQ